MNKEPMCECGDTESQHVDGCEQCVVPECGCKEFTEVEKIIAGVDFGKDLENLKNL